MSEDPFDYDNYKPTKRDISLEQQWKSHLPCADCLVSDICRYRNAVPRVNYPPEVFNVSITCNIKGRYRKEVD